MAPSQIAIAAVRASLDPRWLAARPVARVLATYRSAVSLLAGDELITLASVSAGGLPGGVLVADGFAPRALGIGPGTSVALSSEAIELGSLRVTIDAAEPWDPRLGALEGAGDGLAARAIVARTALRTAGADGLGLLPGALERLTAFAAASGSRVTDDVGLAGEALVGLGLGLTPAGDDLLVGYSACLTALGDPAARMLARRWAGIARERTTVVAATYHRHAARGDYAERVHDLVAALLRGRTEAIPAAILAAARHGATSGVDLVTGAVAALEAAGSPTAARQRPAA